MSKPKFKVLIVVALLTLIAGCEDTCKKPYYEHCLKTEIRQEIVPASASVGGIRMGSLRLIYVPRCVKSERRIKPHCVEQINATEEEALEAHN